jgi:hypothetical protein
VIESNVSMDPTTGKGEVQDCTMGESMSGKGMSGGEMSGEACMEGVTLREAIPSEGRGKTLSGEVM